MLHGAIQEIKVARFLLTRVFILHHLTNAVHQHLSYNSFTEKAVVLSGRASVSKHFLLQLIHSIRPSPTTCLVQCTGLSFAC